jgi:hypothetical protein
MKYGEQDDGPLPHVYARYTARGLIGGKWQNENALTINDIVKARSIVCRFAKHECASVVFARTN